VHDAAGVIQAGAHEALEELRAVIGVLRHNAGDEPEPPQPGLEAVRDLVADARRCGSEVRCDDRLAVMGAPLPPGATGRVAYRVVQEALTNARKHAPGSLVELVMDGRPGDGLRIEVTNPVPAEAGTGSMPGSGLGLVGVAERVELAGGRLVHGTAAGRFRLEVRLPWLA
jgi:signal transduction histidine kinase